jgi:hypothetical protein
MSTIGLALELEPRADLSPHAGRGEGRAEGRLP